MGESKERTKSHFLILLKLRLEELLNAFTGRTDKKRSSRGGMIALFVFLILSLAFLFTMIFLSMCIGLTELKLQWLYMGFVFIFSFLLLFLGSVFMTYNQLFEGKDNERMLSLPLKPRAVLMSRLTSLLVLNYGYELLVALPAGVVYLGYNGGSIAGVIIYILLLLVVPLLVLTISVIFAWLMGIILSRIKRKNIFTIILSVIGMGAYMYLCFGWQSQLNKLVENGAEIADRISRHMLPVYWYGKAVVDHNIIYLLIMMALCIIPFMVTIGAISRSYIKIAMTSRGESRVEYKGGGLKVNFAGNSLIKLELARFLSSPSYMINGGMGLLFIGMLAVFSLIKKGDFLEIFADIGFDGDMTGPVMCFIILLILPFVMISSSAISLEGKTLWIPKSNPTKDRDVLISKAAPHIIASIPLIVIGGVLIQIAIPMGIISRIFIIVLPIAATIFNGLAGVYVNLSFPKFDWLTETAAIKQGISSFLAMLLTGAVAMVFMLAFIFWYFAGINPELFLILATIIYGLLAVGAYALLTTSGLRKWEAL